MLSAGTCDPPGGEGTACRTAACGHLLQPLTQTPSEISAPASASAFAIAQPKPCTAAAGQQAASPAAVRKALELRSLPGHLRPPAMNAFLPARALTFLFTDRPSVLEENDSL